MLLLSCVWLGRLRSRLAVAQSIVWLAVLLLVAVASRRFRLLLPSPWSGWLCCSSRLPACSRVFTTSPLSPFHFAPAVAVLLLSYGLLVRLQLGLAAAQSRVWLAVLLHCSHNCRYSLPPFVAAQSVVWLTVLLLAAGCFPVSRRRVVVAAQPPPT